AHRMPQQVERFGRLLEHDAGHALERINRPVTIDRARIRESRELRRKGARVANQSGQEQQHRSRGILFAGVKFSSIRKASQALEALSQPSKRLWRRSSERRDEPMSYAAIHPDWEKPRRNMADGYSLEMTAKELDGLREAAPLIRPNTQVAVTSLPGEEMEQRVAAAVLVRELGFEPIVHLSARRLESEEQLDWYLGEITGKAKVKRVFIIAGDPPEPVGPYSDSLQIIETGLLQKHGIEIVGIGGHPEGRSEEHTSELQ